MNTGKTVKVMLVVILAVMLVGEAMVYTANPYSYSSDVTYDGGPGFTVESSASADFRVVQTTYGEMAPVEEVYVYSDTRYGVMNAPDDGRPVGYLVKELEMRGVRPVTVDADGLRELFLSGDGSGKAVVFMSGALPSTVYTGNPDDPFFGWFEDGGSVYWFGTTIGRYVGEDDGTAYKVPGYGDLFFGEENMSYSLDDRIGSVQTEFTDVLSLRAADARFGISASVPFSKEVGYVTDDGFSSASLVKFGKGMLGIVSGVYDNAGRDSFAQIIASGITYDSEVVGVTDVHVRGGSASGDLADVPGSGVYIYAGGFYVSHASHHVLDRYSN